MKEQKYIADSKTELFEERQTYSKYLYALEQTFDQFPVFEHKEPAPVAATGATSQQEEIAIAASTAQEPSNNTAAHPLQHSTHVWLWGRFGCLSPWTKELHDDGLQGWDIKCYFKG